MHYVIIGCSAAGINAVEAIRSKDKLSKIIASAAIRGAREIHRQADEFINKASKEKGDSAELKFPETAFYLPMRLVVDVLSV